MSVDAIICQIEQHGKWSPEELCHIFSRLVIAGLLENSLPAARAEAYATKAAHYGRLALQDEEVRREGWAVVNRIVGIA